MSDAQMAAPPAGSAGAARPHYKRSLRNYLIDAPMQLRFASYLVLVASVLALLLGWQLWTAFREANRLLALGDSGADEAIAALVAREDRTRMLWLGGAFGGLVVCLMGFGLVVTHRVAGPALVIARTCRQVGQGLLRRPRPLRQGDLLVALSRDVAGMVDAVRAREEAERTALVEAAAQLSRGADGLVRAQAVIERLAAEKAERLKE
jgi:hypothetical protein